MHTAATSAAQRTPLARSSSGPINLSDFALVFSWFHFDCAATRDIPARDIAVYLKPGLERSRLGGAASIARNGPSPMNRDGF